MKAREVFGLVLRTIGVLGLAYMVRQIVRNPDVPTIHLVVRVVCVVFGVYFLRGAPLLVKFAYPEPPGAAPEKASG